MDLTYPESPAGPLAGEPAIPAISLIRESPDDGARPPELRRPLEERLEDFRYRVTMRASRMYTYQAYVSVDLNPPHGQRIQKLVPYAGTITVKAATDVLVRDTTPPRIMASIPGNPLSTGSAYTLYAATGGRLQLGAAEVDPAYPPPADNPGYITVYIEDNNPFDSYPGSAEAGYVNQGRGSAGGYTESNPAAAARRASESPQGRYANLHTQERYARMSYEAFAVCREIAGDSPVPVDEIKRYELPAATVAESLEEQYDSRYSGTAVTVMDEFTGDPALVPAPGDGVSRARYEMALDAIHPVSLAPVDGAVDAAGCPVYAWTDRFCSRYATNYPGWQSPALFASFSDSSGNTLPDVRLADIHIRDNIQPNPILELEIIGRSAGERTILPSELPGEWYSHERFVYEPEDDRWEPSVVSRFRFMNNGDWYPGYIAKQDPAWVCHLDTSQLSTDLWTDDGQPFPVSPVILSFAPVPERTRLSLNGRFSSDNIGSAESLSLFCTVRRATGDIVQQIDDWRCPRQFVLYTSDDLQNSPGQVVEGYLEDNALDWDGSTSRPNRRYFRYFLPVYPTSIRTQSLQTSIRLENRPD